MRVRELLNERTAASHPTPNPTMSDDWGLLRSPVAFTTARSGPWGWSYWPSD